MPNKYNYIVNKYKRRISRLPKRKSLLDKERANNKVFNYLNIRLKVSGSRLSYIKDKTLKSIVYKT